MLALEVEFLHGTFRGSSDDLALAGTGEISGEWPPSPARLFAALVAADGTRDRCRFTDGAELRFLEDQPPPQIYADRRSHVERSPLIDRYVVVNARAKSGAVQEYVGRTASLARGGARLSPRHPRVVYVWDASAPGAILEGLERRCSRIGYLGCSDSPVRVRVFGDFSENELPGDRWVPDPDGDAIVSVPFPGLVEILDEIYDTFTTVPSGTITWAPRRSSYPIRYRRYRSPEAPVDPHRAPVTPIWLRFDGSIPGRRILRVTETLRRAVLDLYQRLVAGDGNPLPPILTGHGLSGSRYSQVSWLALPDVGHPHSRGRIFGAAILIPDDAPDEVAAGLFHVVRSLDRLVLPGSFDVGVAPHGGERRPWAAHPVRWTAPAERFVSAFPVVHERFARPRPTLQDITQWCTNAGLPEPVEFQLAREPMVPGGVDLHPREARRKSTERRPFSHLLLTFAEPVVGPVVIGAGRRFGLGLMAPLPLRKEEKRREHPDA